MKNISNQNMFLRGVIMAIDSGYLENEDNYMSTDEVAALLVKLYSEYRANTGCHEDDYAKAVGIAIRRLIDE